MDEGCGCNHTHKHTQWTLADWLVGWLYGIGFLCVNVNDIHLGKHVKHNNYGPVNYLWVGVKSKRKIST